MSEAVVAQKSPYSVEVEAGKAYWRCACGRSKSQPLCDGSHKGSGLTPVKYEAARSETVWFCGCKQTRGRPLCDGTHSTL